MVRAAGFEPAISAFQVRRGQPNSPTPCVGRGSGGELFGVAFIMVS